MNGGAGVRLEAAGRAERLAERVAERELDWLLVSNLVNVRYLTGFTGTNALAAVAAGGERLFLTDFRYVEQAAAQVDAGFERLRGRQDLLGEAAERLTGRVGFDDAHLTVRQHRRLSELAGEGVSLVAAGGVVEELRAVKEPGELERIRSAAGVVDEVLGRLAEDGLRGRTERQVALWIESALREHGAEGPSFPPIVAAGAHAALPHAEPREEPIPADALVIVDLGAVVGGYCSDCTRTFATGAVGDRELEVYELVRRAQEAGLGAVRAGEEGRAVDAVARRVIDEGGYGDQFGHGLGHGVGIEVHEGPRLSPLAEDRLSAGNVVTVEPGVYVPGKHGVRIEDLVAVGEDGCEVLSAFPKTLVEVG